MRMKCLDLVKMIFFAGGDDMFSATKINLVIFNDFVLASRVNFTLPAEMDLVLTTHRPILVSKVRILLLAEMGSFCW